MTEYPAFGDWLIAQGIELCRPVIDAKGGGNLLPKNITPSVALLKAKSAQHIVILTDSDGEPLKQIKQRIANEHTDLVFIAVKAIEAWFLADTNAMNRWLGLTDFIEEKPQETSNSPWDRLKVIASKHDKQGPGSKLGFAKRMVKHYGFEVSNAAAHNSCPSAREFTNGILACRQS